MPVPEKDTITMTQAHLEALLAKVSGGSASITPDQLATILGAVKPSREDMAYQAELNAKATQKAVKPENVQDQGKSVYSYPEGDLARPRDGDGAKTRLDYPIFYAGNRVDYDVSTAEELELFNAIRPGKYTIEKTDGSFMEVTAEADIEVGTGKISRLIIHVPMKLRGQMQNMPKLKIMLREMIAQHEKQHAVMA